MGYRDDKAVLRERVDQLELSLAKIAGRAIRLEEERDRYRDEVETLSRDPRAIARRQRKMAVSRLPFFAMRVAGLLMLMVGVIPMVILALAMFFNEPAGGLVCASFPALIVMGAMALKLPELVTWLQLREERRRGEREADLLVPRARVELDLQTPVEPVHVEAEASPAKSAERRAD